MTSEGYASIRMSSVGTVPAVRQRTRAVIERAGWSSGSSLEDYVALRLWRFGFHPAEVAQQHRVLSYRLDFAWPELKVALEADGFRHIFDPATARTDAERDSALRGQGWLIFRVDDQHGDEALDRSIARVAAVIRALAA